MKTTDKIVVYLRVSTKEQGMTGYGLEAQKEFILNFFKEEQIAFEYSEIASGNDNSRPKLKEAIDKCEQFGYTLVVAKLDRLGRNVKYLFEIKERVKNIKVCNMPDFDTLQFGIYATIAQHERELISTRTKDALQARYDKTGLKNGNKKGCDTSKARFAAKISRRQNAMLSNNNQVAKNVIELELEKGTSYRKIAEFLNRIGIRTPKNKDFSVSSIQSLIKLYGLKPPKK